MHKITLRVFFDFLFLIDLSHKLHYVKYTKNPLYYIKKAVFAYMIVPQFVFLYYIMLNIKNTNRNQNSFIV